jgi:hypothetical protein
MKYVTGRAEGKHLKIQDFGQIPLPKGGMINGIITDESIITDFFMQTGREHNLFRYPTYAIIVNNSVHMRTMDVPAVSENRIMAFARNEIIQRGGGGEDDVYDYTVLNPSAPSGGVTILAVGVSRTLIQSYRDALPDAGFRLKGMNIGINCLIKLVRFLPSIRKQTCIVGVIDGRLLALIFFSGGEYRIANRYRIVHPEGSKEWCDEIGSHLSPMLQFSKSQRNDDPVEGVYFAGADSEYIESLGRRNHGSGTKIQELTFHKCVACTGLAKEKDDFQPGRFVLNMGSLLKK